MQISVRYRYQNFVHLQINSDTDTDIIRIRFLPWDLNTAEVQNVLVEDESEDEFPPVPDLMSDESPSKLPRDNVLSDAEFGTLRQVEGFAMPTAQVTRILEGEKYVMGNKGMPALKLLALQYNQTKLQFWCNEVYCNNLDKL